MWKLDYLLGLFIMAVAVFIYAPVMVNWTHLIFSGRIFNGDRFSLEPILNYQFAESVIRFTFGVMVHSAGQALWMTANNRKKDNVTNYSQQNNYRYGDSYKFEGPVNNTGYLGPRGSVRDINNQRSVTQISKSEYLILLADELLILKEEMKNEATTNKHRKAIKQIAKAEKSARSKNETRVKKYLASAGSWALDVATKISVPIAQELLKISLGIPPK